MNYLDVLKTIYTKQRLAVVDDIGLCISLTRTLAKDQDNLPVIKEISSYLFYIKPVHYFYLLYIMIPKKSYIPRLPKYEKVESIDEPILNSVKEILQWSDREFLLHRDLLETIFLQDKKFWETELSIEKKPKKEKIKNGQLDCF